MQVRKSCFSEEQSIAVLKEQAAGISVVELCQIHGTSGATFYVWRKH